MKNEVLTYSTSSKSHEMNTFLKFLCDETFSVPNQYFIVFIIKTQGHQKRFSDINLSTLLLSMINYVDS